MGGGVLKTGKTPSTPVNCDNLFKNRVTSTLPTMDIPTTESMDSAFAGMPNITQISLQNCNNVTNMRHMCDGNVNLTREPSGIRYDKCKMAYCAYRKCGKMRPIQSHSFPVCKNLEGAFQQTAAWDEYTSYEVNAPVATTVAWFFREVPKIVNVTFRIGNQSCSLRDFASYSIKNYNSCEISIISPTLIGDMQGAFANRSAMTKFPFSPRISGDLLGVDLYGSSVSFMFTNDEALRLPTNSATRKIDIIIPYATEARDTFSNTYIWGSKDVALPLTVNVQVPKATNIGSLVRLPAKVAGSIDHLTINAPTATYASYCVGSLYARNGYKITIPLAKPGPGEGSTVPIYHADITSAILSNLDWGNGADESILPLMDGYTGSIHIYNCPNFHPRYINHMLSAKDVWIHGGTILYDGVMVVSQPHTIPLPLHYLGRTYNSSNFRKDPTWQSLQNLLSGTCGDSMMSPSGPNTAGPHVKWFKWWSTEPTG